MNMNMGYLNERVSLYLHKNGYNEPDEIFRLFDKGDGIYIGKWLTELKQPTIEELKSYTIEDINKFIKQKEKHELKNKKLYRIIEQLCIKLNINIDELL
jgi:hypothetical protein